MANTKAFKVKNNLEMGAYNDTIGATANTLFVYDTSLDSDGGAWRFRTHNTSWYNEALNTSTRGSRREFPAVSIIVGEEDTVTIFDADGPELEMWMVYDQGAYTFLAPNSRSTTSVYMLNGILCIGRKAGTGFMHYSSFIDDSARAYSSNANEYRDWLKPISERNTTDAYVRTNSNYAITDDDPNSVRMAVLDNAPINTATGLPQPTIMVGGDTDVSFITDRNGDGQTCVDYFHSSYDISRCVAMSETGLNAYTMDNSSNQRWIHVNHKAPYANITKDTGYNGTGDDEMYHCVNNSDYTQQSMKLRIAAINGGICLTKNDDIAAGSASGAGPGVALINRNPSYPSAGMICTIGHDHNTGWVVGGDKAYTLGTGYPNRGALFETLMDTKTADMVGGELVTNGTFTTDLTGWTVGGTGASAAVVSSQCVLTRNGTSATLIQNITTVVGETYLLSFDFIATTGGAYIQGVLGGTSGSGIQNTTGVTYFAEHVATSTSTQVKIEIFNTASGTVTFDNVSVYVAQPDRSCWEDPFRVYGTINRTVVNTGADIVSFSGFGSNNYLLQPYQSHLDWGTNDFTIVCWMKQSAYTDTYSDIIDRAEIGSSAGRMEFYWNTSHLNLRIGGTSTTASSVAKDNVWVCVAAVRRNGFVTLYLDGKEVGSGTNSGTITNSSGDGTFVGTNYNGDNGGQNKEMALLRMSAMAASEAQIRKIYEDEIKLFFENAQGTVYGTSSTIAAVAYDNVKDELHVGTSAGRSVFQGLIRVDNTTDAVSDEISAYNGLVIDE